MAPRRYTRHRRDAAMAETRRRIVEATVALHAEHGAARTTYAMIAARADVAVPTVYKHFPDLTALFGACTSHAGRGAPALGPELFDGIDDTADRLRALASALFARHRALAPWLRWSQHEAALIPELGSFHARTRDEHLRFIRDALSPRFGSRPPEALIGLVEILTRYSAWETLTKDRGLSPEEAVAAVIDALDAASATFAAPTQRTRPDKARSRS